MTHKIGANYNVKYVKQTTQCTHYILETSPIKFLHIAPCHMCILLLRRMSYLNREVTVPISHELNGSLEAGMKVCSHLGPDWIITRCNGGIVQKLQDVSQKYKTRAVLCRLAQLLEDQMYA